MKMETAPSNEKTRTFNHYMVKKPSGRLSLKSGNLQRNRLP